MFIVELSLKFTNLRLQSNPLGANEVTVFNDSRHRDNALTTPHWHTHRGHAHEVADGTSQVFIHATCWINCTPLTKTPIQVISIVTFFCVSGMRHVLLYMSAIVDISAEGAIYIITVLEFYSRKFTVWKSPWRFHKTASMEGPCGPTAKASLFVLGVRKVWGLILP